MVLCLEILQLDLSDGQQCRRSPREEVLQSGAAARSGACQRGLRPKVCVYTQICIAHTGSPVCLPQGAYTRASKCTHISKEIFSSLRLIFFIKRMILFKMRDPFKMESLECKGVTGNAWYGPVVKTPQSNNGRVFLSLWAGCELHCGRIRSALSVPFTFFQGICLNFQVSLEMSVTDDFYLRWMTFERILTQAD